MLNAIMFVAIGFLAGMAISVMFGKVQYLRDVFSENSVASFGRFASYHAVIASIVWVSWVVYKTSVIPDLSGVCFFIGTLYGLSAAKAVVTALKGTSNDQPNP